MLALDLDRWEAWRQSAARHDVLGPDLVRLVVEIDEIAGRNIYCADAEAHLARIDPVEIDQLL